LTLPYEGLKLPLLLPGLLLVMFRVLGLAISAPIFSSAVIPRRAKALLAVATAMMAFPLVQPTLPADLTLPQVLAGVVGEMMVGLAIGYGLSMVFSAAQLAGSMIDQQAGMALGHVLNPALESNSTVMGQLLFFVVMAIFLAMNGHVAVVRSILESFGHVPPLAFRATPSVTHLMVGLLTSSFVLAIRIGGPALTALFLVTLAKGFLSRTIPQLNVLAVGFSITSMVALVMTAVSLTVGQDLLVDELIEAMATVRALLEGKV
jgi:flagellar biosynthetic protein FliR